MIQTEDLNVTGVNPLTAPKFIKAEYPISDKASETVFKFRKQIKDVLDEKDSRQLVIVGPCSIHHADIALDYADKLTKLILEVEDKLLVVMRVYFEKPPHNCRMEGIDQRSGPGRKSQDRERDQACQKNSSQYQ